MRWQAVVLLVLVACGRSGFDAVDANDAGPEAALRDGERYAAAVLADGPLAYWRFDEAVAPNVMDASGNGHTGIYKSVVLGQPGIFADASNPAVKLAAADSAIELGDKFGFVGTAPFTVELWAQPTTRPDGFLLGKVDFDTGTTTYPGWFMFYDEVQTGMRRALINVVGPPIPLDQYSHLVVTYDGFTVAVFLDGVMVAQRATTQPMPVVPSQFVIGRMYPTQWAPFLGWIDEVALYDRALPPSRVMEHYRVARP